MRWPVRRSTPVPEREQELLAAIAYWEQAAQHWYETACVLALQLHEERARAGTRTDA